MGAGGGGFLLLFVPPELQAQVREKLKRLIYVPFAFESSGCRIIFYEPEEDHSDLDRARAGGSATRYRRSTRARGNSKG